MLIGLALPQRVEAKSGPSPDTANLDEPKSHSVRSWEDEHRQGLQAMRLSVAIGALNVPWLAGSGATWLAAASGEPPSASRSAVYFAGSVQVAGAIGNLVWLVFAGENLGDYKQHSRDSLTVRRARLHTALSTIDTAFRIPGIVIGGIWLARGGRSAGSSFDRTFGLILLIPNLLVLPFHVWSVFANARELKHAKRQVRAAGKARRVEPIPSGFRF